MREKNTRKTLTVIDEILNSTPFPASDIKPLRENDYVSSYLIDGKYILKISESMSDDHSKLERVRSLPLAPALRSSGSRVVSGCEYFYTLVDYIHGGELLGAIPELSEEQQHTLGYEMACFLDGLHSIRGAHYDVGHYVPAVPGYRGSWKDGHAEYVKLLTNGLTKIDLEPRNISTAAEAFGYIAANIGALDYQAGAVLLHNDLHPKNIIVRDGRLAGVIDWECSQYGEADFELVHLVHWCAYPPEPDKKFPALIKTIIGESQAATRAPDLATRMTIYQLEHDLNQMIWNGKAQENERTRRITGWLDGMAETTMNR